MLYARATRWLCVPHIERRMALIVFLCTLPALAMGLHADDYILREQVLDGGPFAAYLFSPLDPQAAHTRMLDERTAGRVPWWADEHTHVRFFRPLSSLSLWLDFAHGAPPWSMHLENGAVYAAMVWLAVALYKQLGLSGAGLGWAAVFFGLDGALAAPVGWIAGRNTLLAACFGGDSPHKRHPHQVSVMYIIVFRDSAPRVPARAVRRGLQMDFAFRMHRIRPL